MGNGMSDQQPSECVVETLNADVDAPTLLVCEHASNHIPDSLNMLGLSEEVRRSHIAWDPGAYAVASHLSKMLDAPLVASKVSRLVHDCNRPPDATDAMPAKSELFEVPGNRDLSTVERQERVQRYYLPFERAVQAAIVRFKTAPALVTIHSFTPTYYGQSRAVELGILHDEDSRLADAILALAPEQTSLITLRNEPYGPEDGVTHTLKTHAIQNKLPNVMIEIRNDLISTPEDVLNVATMLSRLLNAAFEKCGLIALQDGSAA